MFFFFLSQFPDSRFHAKPVHACTSFQKATMVADRLRKATVVFIKDKIYLFYFLSRLSKEARAYIQFSGFRAIFTGGGDSSSSGYGGAGPWFVGRQWPTWWSGSGVLGGRGGGSMRSIGNAGGGA